MSVKGAHVFKCDGVHRNVKLLYFFFTAKQLLRRALIYTPYTTITIPIIFAVKSTVCLFFVLWTPWFLLQTLLTHWGRVTHICVSKLTIIGSDNGMSPGWRQAIIRTNAGILLIRPLETNFSEFLVEILIFSFKKMRLKVSSAKRRSFCLGLNELKPHNRINWMEKLYETNLLGFKLPIPIG